MIRGSRNLSEGRQTNLNNKETELRGRGMNLVKIELTEFCDKRIYASSSSTAANQNLKKNSIVLRDLRDQLAHAATFVDGSDGKTGVAAFVDKFESAKRWIDELTKLAANRPDTK